MALRCGTTPAPRSRSRSTRRQHRRRRRARRRRFDHLRRPLVDCYDAGLHDTATGLPRTASSTSAAGRAPALAPSRAPILRDVTLVNGTCTDPYFSSAAASCTIGVSAKVDFGAGDPIRGGAKLTATVGGNDYTLTFDAPSGKWQSAASMAIAPVGAGPVPVTLEWEETKGHQGGNTCKTGNGNKCTGSFGTVQRAFSASGRPLGPDQARADLGERRRSGPTRSRRAAPSTASCTHNMVVQHRGRGQPRDAQSVNDPIVVASRRRRQPEPVARLRPRPTTSRTSSPTAAPPYREHGHRLPRLAGALWATAQPWPCVAIQTGSAVNQVPAGTEPAHSHGASKSHRPARRPTTGASSRTSSGATRGSSSVS